MSTFRSGHHSPRRLPAAKGAPGVTAEAAAGPLGAQGSNSLRGFQAPMEKRHRTAPLYGAGGFRPSFLKCVVGPRHLRFRRPEGPVHEDGAARGAAGHETRLGSPRVSVLSAFV